MLVGSAPSVRLLTATLYKDDPNSDYLYEQQLSCIRLLTAISFVIPPWEKRMDVGGYTCEGLLELPCSGPEPPCHCRAFGRASPATNVQGG
jgi:hypothetical protein